MGLTAGNRRREASVGPVIRLRSSAPLSMPCRSRCVPLASKRRYCWTLKDRSLCVLHISAFSSLVFVFVGIYRLGDPDGAPISSLSTTGGKKSRKSILGSACCGTALPRQRSAAWWHSSHFTLLMRAVCTSPASVNAITPCTPAWFRSAWPWSRCGSRPPRLTSGRSCAFSGRVGLPLLPTPGRTAFFRTPCRFTCSICLSIRTCSGFVFVLAILSALLFWVTARGWQLFERVRYGRLMDGPTTTIDFGGYLRLPGATRTPFVRVLGSDFIAWFCSLGLSGQL